MFLESIQVPARHGHGAGQIEKAQIATLNELMGDVLPLAERFMEEASRPKKNPGEIRRLFTQAFVVAEDTINAGRDLGAFSFDSAGAMRDLIDNMRADAGKKVKDATEKIESGLNEVDSALPNFAVDAKAKLKWIRGFAAELAGDRVKHDEQLEL